MKRERRLLGVPTTFLTTFVAWLPAATASAGIDRVVTLYAEPGFGGASVVVKHDTPRLDLRGFDRRAASVLLPPGVTASLYTGSYYSGTCVSVRESQASLAELLGDASVASVRIGQDCTSLNADAARAALYDEDGVQLTVFEDVPDLGSVGFGHRATGIQFPASRAPHAVAAYSGANYQGTCETFVASASLAGTTIGAGAISSLRLNYTCDGPVRSAPVITGLDVAYSTVDDASAVCPSGYSRDAQDLNAGTHDEQDSSPGHYIHACVKYGPLVAGHSFLTDIWIGVVGDLQPWDLACYPAPSDDYDPVQVPDNLNGGAGGEGLTFCYARSTVESVSPGAVAVQELGFISFPDWWDALGRDLQGRCETELGRSQNVEYFLQNLNAGTDFIGDDDAIFLCEWKPVRAFDSPNPYLFTPTGIKAAEDPYDPEGTRVRYAVSAFDKDGSALTPQCSPGSSDALGFYTLVHHGQTSATVSCTATDAEGRTQTASFPLSVEPYRPGHLLPTITAKAESNGQPYAGEWTRHSVVVSFTCQDGAGRPLHTVTPPITFDHEVLNGAVGGTCTDTSGNVVGTTFADINVDRTAPTVVGRGNGLTGPAWYNRPFQIVWEGRDALSGIGRCDFPDWYFGPESAAMSRTGKCVDRAGNLGTGAFLFAFDSTPPPVTAVRAPAPNAAGWNNTDVVVRASGGDALSGIDTCNQATISSEGRDQSATVSCRDRAGNFGHATLGGINVDRTGPSVKVDADRPPDGGGFYRQPFTVTWTGQDGLSGLSGCSAPITYAGPDTAAGQLEGYCDDVAGNRTLRSFPFRYDASPPGVAIVSAPAGPINAPTLFGWAGSDAAGGSLLYRHRFEGPSLVVGAWSAFGPATKAIFTPSADGSYTLEVEAQDEAGNVSATAHGFSVDVSGPAIEISVPADGAGYVRFTDVHAKYGCTDAGAGMSGGACLGTVDNGSPIPAQAPGPHPFTVHARDALGNVSGRSVAYDVVNPSPVLKGPASAPAGTTKLEIRGSGFVPESHLGIETPDGRALWFDGFSVSRDLKLIEASFPGTGLGEGVWRMRVSNPQPGGGSDELLLFAAPAGAEVSDVDVSSDGSATIGGAGPGTPGSLSVTGKGGEGTLAVAEYASNPAGGVSFSSSDAFFDAYVAPGSSYSSVTITACDLNGGNFVVWWEGAKWRDASPQSYDPASGCVTITVTDSSSPSLSQLTGTIFGGGFDTTPPLLTLPPDQALDPAGPQGAHFSYAAAAHDAVAGPVTPSCEPASGSLFPIGITTVSCTAHDGLGNQAAGSFSVRVKSEAELFGELDALLELRRFDGQLRRLERLLQTDKDARACRQLDVLVARVRRLKPRKLDEGLKASILSRAEALRAAVGCPAGEGAEDVAGGP